MPRKLFVKGQSGNPGGVPNPNKVVPDLKNKKKRSRLKVQEILDMLDFRPFEEMVKLYRDEKTKPRVKCDILVELCNYIAPKLKSVEITGDQEKPFIINLNLDPDKKKLAFTQVVDQTIRDEVDDDDGES